MHASAKLLAILLSAVLASQCATAGGARMMPVATVGTGRAMLAAAEKIPAGSRVIVALTDGRRFKAVLLAVDEGLVVVQKRTRLPEPPVRLEPSRIAYLELDGPRDGLAKMIAIGAAIGTGITLAFLAILAAAVDD